MNTAAEPSLTPDQQQRYLAFVEAGLRVGSKAEFVALILEHVKPLLPHQMSIAGVGRVLPDFSVEIFQVLPIDYPTAYLEAVKCMTGGVVSPIMARWAKSRLPQLYCPEADTGEDITPEWLHIYRRHQLGNQAAHGVHDLHSSVSSYFSFCGLAQTPQPHHAYLLRLLVPHLHIALLQALTCEREAQQATAAESLTPRERQLLALLLSGKPNSEIATLLGRSEKTIRNQLHQLYGKLAVHTRSQAIHRAHALRGEYAGFAGVAGEA